MAQKVLVIDDSPQVHVILRSRLADEAVDLLFTRDATTAVSTARHLQPDLILLDAEMADVSGFDICEQLKSDSSTVGIPILIMTGPASTQDKMHGLDLGATDYVAKPFDPAELRARVRSALRTKALSDLLANRAQIDPLTGLWNRAHFLSRLRATVSLAKRANQPAAALLMDIDGFQVINTRFGRTFGDDLLRQVAGLVLSACRAEDIVARWGSDEIAVLTPNTAADKAETIVDRLRDSLAALRLTHRGQPISVSATFTISDISSGIESALRTLEPREAA